MKTQNTQGPWNASASAGNHQGLVISESTGKTVALTYERTDAALVAAAPELLECLASMVDDYAHLSYEEGNTQPMWRKQLVIAARAAIDKARS